MLVVTFGDSVLDSGRYNEWGITPGALLVQNDDRLFPDFRGRDLHSSGPARLDHRAQDGATLDDLPAQVAGLRSEEPGLAVVSIGGNDLLAGLLLDPGPGIDAWAERLDAFLAALPIRPVLLANVYDPTFGDDARNFLALDLTVVRASHARLNAHLAALAPRYGALVDLYTHFLSGHPAWLVRDIEPSLLGASEIRRCLLATAHDLLAGPAESA